MGSPGAAMGKAFVRTRDGATMVAAQLERAAGIVLIVAGILLYATFGLLQGGFADVGVYAISIVPIVLGLGLVWRASGTPERT